MGPVGILLVRDGIRRPNRSSPLIHDLVLAIVFLAMVIAPAFVAMRADGGEQDS